MIGETISHYKVLEKLGQGGMGVVYKAHDIKLDRFVALKFLPPHLTQSDIDKTRFLQEAQAAAALNHPNVCVIYEVEEKGNNPFIVMEFVEGRTLKDKLQTGPIELKKVIEYAIQIAAALQAAHEKGIVHRDIKSENIMVTGSEQVKVMDFGLAKIRGAANLTKERSTMGTIAYLPPEHLHGQEIDARADIFSFGVVIYEMISGQLPFKGEYDSAVMYSILNEEPEPITKYCPNLSSELLHVINRALEKDPNERYQSVKDMLIDLKRLKRDADKSTVRTQVTNQAEAEAKVSEGSKIKQSKQFFDKKRALKKPLILIGLIIVAAILTLFIFPISQNSEYVENRIVVVPFENKTNDDSFKMLGYLAAEIVTQSISQISILEAVPFISVTDALSNSSEVPSAYKIAEDNKAGVLITGSYYYQDDQLYFKASIMETESQKLLQSLSPIHMPPDSSQIAIKKLSDKILASLAINFGWEIPPVHAYIPSFEAYKEFNIGIELFGTDYQQARLHFMKALKIDSAFAVARIYIAVSHMNQRNYAEADSIFTSLNRRRDELAKWDRLVLDWGIESISGNDTKALQILLNMEQLAPNNLTVQYLIGSYACAVNKPGVTVKTFEKVDKDKILTYYGVNFWWFSVWVKALYMLGEYQEGLRILDVEREHFPDQWLNYLYEGILRAALGETEEVNRIIEESLQFSGSIPGNIMIRAVQSLRANGYREDAHKICQRAVEFFNSHPLADDTYQKAQILYLDEQWTEAQYYFEKLLSEEPNDLDYLGYSGVAAARLGEQEKTDKIFQELYNKDEPYLFGEHLFWCARIAAVRGEKKHAVDLLREAFGKGYGYSYIEHIIIDFESLKDYEPYIELMRPKG